MAPAVGTAPAARRRQVRPQGDQTGARGDHGARPLAQRTGVRGDRIGRQRQTAGPERLGQRAGQAGAQLVPQGGHARGPDTDGGEPVRFRLAQQLPCRGQELGQQMGRVDPGGAGADRLGGGADGRRQGRGAVVGAGEGDAQPGAARVGPQDECAAAGPVSQGRGRPV